MRVRPIVSGLVTVIPRIGAKTSKLSRAGEQPVALFAVSHVVGDRAPEIHDL
jgi:hypothetical protein